MPTSSRLASAQDASIVLERLDGSADIGMSELLDLEIGGTAFAQPLVEVVDQVGQWHGDDQVEDAREQQRRQVAVRRGGVLTDPEQLALTGEQAQEVDQAGFLDQGNELVDQRGQD